MTLTSYSAQTSSLARSDDVNEFYGYDYRNMFYMWRMETNKWNSLGFIVDDERGSSLSMIHEDISYNDLIGVVLEDFGMDDNRNSIRCLRPDPPSPSRSAVSVQIHEADEIETQNLKMLNPQQDSQLIAEFVPFSSDKRYATTQVKAPPQLQKTGAVRMSTVSHGFVYEPYALHEKILWW
ncbi:hypothetical protein F2Q68_00034578 [Brassica cretica]|uniref:Uncharacterized protein n=2 Tax=Brassica cretica TaxID=69181 RepID=A0A8S9MNT3_BRACR|nr:hypothetical protein F2Q68_00034578 [Brassica cretica]KAF3485555.1 hypothetical protein F2Q69_00053362 [Brassica cretica]